MRATHAENFLTRKRACVTVPVAETTTCYVLSTSFVMYIIMTTLQTFYILIGEDTKNSSWESDTS